MATTYIAFRECVLDDDPPFWKSPKEDADPEEEDPFRDTREMYISQQDGAKLILVDLEGTKRHFIFKSKGVLEIVGNVAIFQDRWIEKNA